MAATLKQARSDLYDAIVAAAIANLTVVLPYEPQRDEIYADVTLAVSSAGMSSTDWRIACRLYVKTAAGMAIAWGLMETVLMEVDHAVDSRYGDSEWRIKLLEADALLQGECIYERGRED